MYAKVLFHLLSILSPKIILGKIITLLHFRHLKAGFPLLNWQQLECSGSFLLLIQLRESLGEEVTLWIFDTLIVPTTLSTIFEKIICVL